MNRENFFNIIDFGSSNIRFSVFDQDLNEKFSEIRNLIFMDDYSKHIDVTIEMIKKAEKKNSYHINDIILLLETLELFTIEISLDKNISKNSNLNKVYEALKLELNQLISTNYINFKILHVITNKFIIDDKVYNELPKTEFIKKNLKVDFKIICFPKKLIEKIKKKFALSNLNVKSIFCSSYIRSSNYLKNFSDKRVSFLDIGLSRTSLIYYEKNKLKLINSIPIGSHHVTKDISNIFKISIEDAEKLKKSFNKYETEFSYHSNLLDNNEPTKDLIEKQIPIKLLKKVILYRVQEIIDLIFEKAKSPTYDIDNSRLILIGEGSKLFNNNSFYLNDKFQFKSIDFYSENVSQICKFALIYYLNNFEAPKLSNKNTGIFEKFFNYFSR